jgi:hypothetical protein
MASHHPQSAALDQGPNGGKHIGPRSAVDQEREGAPFSPAPSRSCPRMNLEHAAQLTRDAGMQAHFRPSVAKQPHEQLRDQVYDVVICIGFAVLIAGILSWVLP